MLQLERQKLILEYLKQNRKATTNELSEMLGVSTTTIRTDLNQMDKEKLLTKTHGGALYHDNSADNKELTGKAYFFHERALENKKEKEAIAANAIHMVKDHMCIFLDASSTAYTLGMKLTGFTELTVITNGIDLALALKDIPGITVILPLKVSSVWICCRKFIRTLHLSLHAASPLKTDLPISVSTKQI